MKKRILASFLSLVLVLSLVPVSALAAEEQTGPETPVCAELAGCTEDAHDPACPLYVAPGGDNNAYYEFEDVTTLGAPTALTTQATDGMSGNCGATESNSVTWALTENEDGEDTYTLTISGEGAMADYAKNSTAATDEKPIYTSAPWRTASVVKTENVLSGDTTYGGTYYTGITRIVVENGVTRIGSSAFSYMKDVKEVSIADSVTSIGDRAFMYNYSLESITLPDSVKMETLYESNQDGDGELLLGHCYSLKNVTLGSGFTVIPCRAFEGTNISPEQITMDRSKITGIGTQAFYNNTMSAEELDLTSFSSLKDLRSNTFSFWTIERVKFPASLEELSSFNTVEGLSEVNWTDLTNLKKIAANAFKETEIEAADLSNTQITDIGWGAFENCGSLATVVLPDTVTTIGGDAFIGLPAGSTITVSDDKYTLLTGKYTPENTSIITVGASVPGEEETIGLTHNGTTTFFSSLASAANNAVSGDTIFATGAYTFGDDEVAVVRAGVTLTGENLSGYGATFANDERTAYCGTLQTALASCEDGDTVTLNTDVTVSANMTVSKNISIDLNKKTVTSTAFAAPFLVKSNVNCTIANGTIANTASNYGICVDTENGSNTILSKLTLTNTNKTATAPSSVRVRSCTLVLSGVNMSSQLLYTVNTAGQNEPTVFFAGSNTMGSTVFDNLGTWSLYFDSSNTEVLTANKSNAIRYFLNCSFEELTSYSPIEKNGQIPLWYSDSNLSGEPVESPQANNVYYAKWAGLEDFTLQYNGTKELKIPGVTLSGFQSDKPTVATVDNSGNVTAKGVGTATVSATGTYNGQQITFKATVTVTPMPITFGNNEGENPHSTITYQYTGMAPEFSQFAKFYPAEVDGDTVSIVDGSETVTLTEGTDIVFVYDAGAGEQQYDYLPINVTEDQEYGIEVTVKLVNENYRFVTSTNTTPSDTVKEKVIVTDAGKTEVSIIGLPAVGENPSYAYTGKAIAPIGNLTRISAGTIEKFTVHFHPWGDTNFAEAHLTEQPASALTPEAIATIAPKEPGSYLMIVDGTNDTEYVYQSWIFTITKATVTIRPNDKKAYVGDAVPALGENDYTVTGLADGEPLTKAPTLSYASTPDMNTTGTYAIKASGAAVPNTDHYNSEIVYQDGTLTVSRRSSGGGGGGSSSSSTTTETEKNPDGSTTTTVTDKKTGTVTETTKFKDGSTLVVETKKDGTITTTETAKNGVKVRTVDEPGEDVTATVTIPRSVGEAVVTIPADVDYGMVAVDADTGEIMKLSVPTEDGMTVKLDGSAELVLVERSLDFTDTNNHWAEDAIDFATAHELFAGTSNTTFSPDSPMTRAMLMTVLARFDGQDTTGGAVWYDKAMAWAKENGISDGSNPDGNITREQFATMLWRYAGSPAVSGIALNEFGDSASVNGYAVDAMRWAVSSGIIGGTDAGLLMPQGNATRAQVATMLMRFVEGLTK